jgi:hypothetical protein
MLHLLFVGPHKISICVGWSRVYLMTHFRSHCFYVVSHDGMIVNDELEMTWREAVVAYFKVVF